MPAGPIATPTSEPILSARRLNKQYGVLRVLDEVDFEMARNEAVGIVGPNGAGKTTFLSVLAGAKDVSSGQVFFQGENVSHLMAADRCQRGLVRTHQVPRPFLGMTVFENAFVAASYGAGADKELAYELAVSALSDCGMSAVANRTGDTLGLLDRKRLELVRAVATQPRLLLLDEIGGGLTEGESSELVDNIRDLMSRNIGIVWIEHVVPVLLQLAQRLICMDGGKIIADGDPQLVMSDPQVVEAYLGAAAT